jgi:hypothetical protein
MGLENKLYLALQNLNGEVSRDEIFRYFHKSLALEILRDMTNQDFGYDVASWKKWIEENRPEVLPGRGRQSSLPDYLKDSYLTQPGKSLEIAYQKYLESNLAFTEAEELIVSLEQNGLYFEAQALKTYFNDGPGAEIQVETWGNRSCRISPELPASETSGDLWFDPVELNLSILVPNPEGISNHVRSWISTHPVYVWQYRAFLNLVQVGEKLDTFSIPYDYLTDIRIRDQDHLKCVADVYHDEAIAYSSWMRKSLCGQIHLKAAKMFLGSQGLKSILPSNFKIWESTDFQEDYRVAVGSSSVEQDPSLEYDDIIDEDYEKLEACSNRMLYEEWDCRENIGLLTKVAVFTGLSEGNDTETFHYQLLNRSPRSILNLA